MEYVGCWQRGREKRGRQRQRERERERRERAKVGIGKQTGPAMSERFLGRGARREA